MKKFIKNKEDFICSNCGKKVVGNGYTNHCLFCFYSKHVDNNPGDRSCECLGLMEPIDILQKNGDLYLLHKCAKCGFERKNKTSDFDDKKKLIELAKNIAQNKIMKGNR